MSLYNMIHGVNPLAGPLLTMLDMKPEQCGRFRDCFLTDERPDIAPLVIAVYTRNGGGNREEYEDVTEELRAHPGFVADYDDDFDCTYATYLFKVPERYVQMLEKLVKADPAAVPASPHERFEAFMTKLKSGEQDEQTRRVIDATKPIFEKLTKALDDTKKEES